MPKQIEVQEVSDDYGRFVVSPLERGFGLTIGNSLRRVLLSSIPGAAVTSVKIEGVLHEFSTIPDVFEDVTEIVLNLKRVRLKLHANSHKDLYLKARGKKVKASDIQKDADVEIVNPDAHIATLASKGKLEMEVGVDIGMGYVPAEQLKDRRLPLGTILIDALFSPVTRVNYQVEKTRVGERTDYDKLILEIWTDGRVYPTDALRLAARIMRDHLALFIRPGETVEETEEERKEREIERKRKALSMRIDEIELSVRSKNCLERGNIKTLGDLVVKTEKEMLAYKNFGKRSLTEVKQVLEGLGLQFGMDVSQYLGKPKRKKKTDET